MNTEIRFKKTAVLLLAVALISTVLAAFLPYALEPLLGLAAACIAAHSVYLAYEKFINRPLGRQQRSPRRRRLSGNRHQRHHERFAGQPPGCGDLLHHRLLLRQAARTGQIRREVHPEGIDAG